MQQSPSLRMDQWRRQRLRQPWCEGQVTATFLPGAARGLREGGGTGLRFWDLHSVVLLPPLGSTPSRTGGFLGTTSPGPMAELYGAANQDSGVSSYISAASPAPSTGFGHSLGVSVPWRALRRGRMMAGAGEEAASPRGDGGEKGCRVLSGREMLPAVPPPSPTLPAAGAGCSSSLGACFPGLHWFSPATTQGPDLQTFPLPGPDVPKAHLGPDAVSSGLLGSLVLAPATGTALPASEPRLNMFW